MYGKRAEIEASGLKLITDVRNWWNSDDRLRRPKARPCLPPADGDASHIRVLTIEPEVKDNDPMSIRCHFHLTNLRDPLSYQALSYAWEGEALTELIWLDEKLFRVSTTLKCALFRIRKHWDNGKLLCKGVRPKLWVDAICIDQKNVKEKSTQVSLMGQIYSKAEYVLIWLGEPVRWKYIDHVKAVREIIDPSTRVKDESVLGRIIDDDRLRITASNNILWCPWFSRRWVVQEVLLQENHWMLLGDFIFDLEKLDAAIDRDRVKTEWMWRPSRKLGDRTLMEYMMLCLKLKCSNPLDLIYSLRGVSIDGDQLVVDYGLDVNQFFVQFALMYACTKCLPLLLVCATVCPGRKRDFPTWVPDWRKQQSSEVKYMLREKREGLLRIVDKYEPYVFDSVEQGEFNTYDSYNISKMLYRSWIGPAPKVISSGVQAHPKLVLTVWIAEKSEHQDWEVGSSDLWVGTGDEKHLEADLYMYLLGSRLVFGLKQKQDSNNSNLYELLFYKGGRIQHTQSKKTSPDELIVESQLVHAPFLPGPRLRMKMRTIQIV